MLKFDIYFPKTLKSQVNMSKIPNTLENLRFFSWYFRMHQWADILLPNAVPLLCL